MMISTLIVDDEPLARESIQLLLQQDPEINIIGTCENGREALLFLEKTAVQLLFLDIQMPQLNGFEVLQQLSKIHQPPAIIFVTAYDEFALNAFEVNAIDYLLKPYNDERFFQALNKAKHLAKNKTPQQETQLFQHLLEFYQTNKKYRQRIPIKSKNKWLIIEVNDIIWLKASSAYTEVKVKNKPHLINESLKQLESELDPMQFIRIHRSTIVNLSYITSMEPYFNGEYFITLKDGSKFKLSRKYRDKVDIIMDNR